MWIGNQFLPVGPWVDYGGNLLHSNLLVSGLIQSAHAHSSMLYSLSYHMLTVECFEVYTMLSMFSSNSM